VLLKITRAQSLNVISVLSLHGNGLIRLKHLQALTRLKRLTVTYNDLTKLDDLSGMVGSSALPVSLVKS
jgi:Leucine-rich repeat (LRR) protein